MHQDLWLNCYCKFNNHLNLVVRLCDIAEKDPLIKSEIYYIGHILVIESDCD